LVKLAEIVTESEALAEANEADDSSDH